MVFGLALSLGALVLISQPPRTPLDLYQGLGIFAFSFLILVTVWYNYSTIMAALPLETRGLVILNLILLFVVAIEPYLLYVLAYYGGNSVGEPASVLYAIDLAAMNAIMAAFAHVLAREERPLIPPAMLRRMRSTRNVTAAMAVIFLVTTLPVFWTWTLVPNAMPMRFVLWTVTLPVGWVNRLVHRW